MMSGYQHYRQRRIEKEMNLYPGFTILQKEQDATVQLQFISKYKHIFTFDLPMKYPFQPPVIKQNGQLLTHLEFDLTICKMYTKVFGTCPCPCCIFSFVQRGWSPAITLKRIVEEIILFEDNWFHMCHQHVESCVPYLPIDIQRQISEYL